MVKIPPCSEKTYHGAGGEHRAIRLELSVSSVFSVVRRAFVSLLNPRVSAIMAVSFSLSLAGFGNENSHAYTVPEIVKSAPLEVCKPDTPGMIAYWPLDDAQGPVPMSFEDVVGLPPNSGNCTVTQNCPSSVAGKINSAFSFDGNDGIAVPYAALFDFAGNASFSFELWAKTGQNCYTQNNEVINNNKVFLGRYMGVNDSSWWLGCGLADPGNPASDQVAVFSLRDDDHIGLEIQSSKVVNDNLWHHLVGVRDGVNGVSYLYVDGQEEATVPIEYIGTFIDTAEPLAPLTIGYHKDSFKLNGILDEVAIYNRDLSPEEIQAHYNGGAGQSYCNSAPVAGNDALNTAEDVPKIFTSAFLLSNDTDEEGDDPILESVATASSQVGIIENNGGGNYTYHPKENFNGTDTFTYTIVDSFDVSGTGTVTVTVNPVNDLPVVTNPGNKTHNEGASPSVQILATDADGEVLTYSASNLPGGLSINASSGLISGVISQTAANSSPYNVTVTATDGKSPVSVNFSWTVNRVNLPPVLTSPGDQFNIEGDEISIQIQVTNADEDELRFVASGLPFGLTIGESTGLMGGAIAGGAKESSPFSVVVTVTEVGTAEEYEDEVTFGWTIKSEWQVFLPLAGKD